MQPTHSPVLDVPPAQWERCGAERSLSKSPFVLQAPSPSPEVQTCLSTDLICLSAGLVCLSAGLDCAHGGGTGGSQRSQPAFICSSLPVIAQGQSHNNRPSLPAQPCSLSRALQAEGGFSQSQSCCVTSFPRSPRGLQAVFFLNINAVGGMTDVFPMAACRHSLVWVSQSPRSAEAVAGDERHRH